MLANILKIGSLSLLVGGYVYLTTQRVSINHPLFVYTFEQLHNHRPHYTLPLFKTLLKLRILKRNQALQQYLLGGGFDPDGSYIEQVEELGFKGIEVGSVCMHANLQEENEVSLGIMKVLANICTYRDNQKQKKSFRVEMIIGPNFQILKYTPYLLKQNLNAALNSFLKVQQRRQESLVDLLSFTFHRKDFVLQESEEVNRLKEETRTQWLKQVQQFNKDHKGKVLLGWQQNKRQIIDWTRLLHYIINKQSL